MSNGAIKLYIQDPSDNSKYITLAEVPRNSRHYQELAKIEY
jgi:hypothetical protein